jgi:single-stranded-DNA-specific exonuclease
VVLRGDTDSLRACSGYIPQKDTEGHGLNTRALDFFTKQGARLIMTLDCGMMNHEEIDEANMLGLDAIIIDHHHVPEVLPSAYAIINPKLHGETYPFRDLCGAGTAFKVAQALFRRFIPDHEDQAKWLLDIVATGTVADVMPLVGENRVLVTYGLIVLSRTKRVGFQEMFRVGRMPFSLEKKPSARDIAFQIAPRINAASRMAHAMLAHDLLMESDADRANKLALELEDHNNARRKLSTEMVEQVSALVESEYADKKFIFAVGETYPFGIVGLYWPRAPTCVFFRELTRAWFIRHSGLSSKLLSVRLLVKFGDMLRPATIRMRTWTYFERFNTLVEMPARSTGGIVDRYEDTSDRYRP